MIYFFGKPWDAAICHEAERVAVPLDMDCHYCDDPIAPEDRGIVKTDEQKYDFIAAHMECTLLETMGHTMRLCPCEDFDRSRWVAQMALDRVNKIRRRDGLEPL